MAAGITPISSAYWEFRCARPGNCALAIVFAPLIHKLDTGTVAPTRAYFLIGLLAIVASSSSLGQGTVIFSNSSSTFLRLPSGERLPVGSTFQVELMFAPDGTPDALFDLLAVRVGAAATISPIRGLFNGGPRTAPTSTLGGPGLFQVRAWETAYGSSYGEAIVSPPLNGRYALVGSSDTLRVFTGDPTPQNPPSEPGDLVGSGFQGFTVMQVPEPNAAVLLMVSVFGLAIWRRLVRE